MSVQEPSEVNYYNLVIQSLQLPVLSRYIAPNKGKGLYSTSSFQEG